MIHLFDYKILLFIIFFYLLFLLYCDQYEIKSCESKKRPNKKIKKINYLENNAHLFSLVAKQQK